MRVKHRQVGRVCAQVEDDIDQAALAATWVRRNATEIAARANSDLDDAPRGISYEPKPRSSGVGDPTGERAAGPPDLIAIQVAVLHKALGEAAELSRRLRLVMARAENTARALLPIDADTAQMLATADDVKHDPADSTRSAVCANPHCQVIVARTRVDRLLAGRCEACYRYRQRTGQERPAELCSPPQVKPCGHPVWHAGRELPCVLEFMHDGRCETQVSA